MFLGLHCGGHGYEWECMEVYMQNQPWCSGIRTRFKPFQSPYWENHNLLDPTAVQLNYFSAVNSPPKPHSNCWRSLRTCTTLHKLTCASNQTSCLSCVLIRCIKYSPKMEAVWIAKSPANRLWVWQATWPWLLKSSQILMVCILQSESKATPKLLQLFDFSKCSKQKPNLKFFRSKNWFCHVLSTSLKPAPISRLQVLQWLSFINVSSRNGKRKPSKVLL